MRTERRPSRRRPGIALFLPLLVGFGCEPNITDRDVEPVPLAKAVKRFERVERNPDSHAIVLIDPRARERFASGHIPGARNIGLGAIPPAGPVDPELANYGLIVVYGEGPNDALARAMVKRLISAGYESVRMLEGGLASWKAAGNPIETSGP